MKVKVPKQWNHWCYRLKLKDTMKYKRLRHKYVSLKGHGRWWRVNIKDEFQYSEVFKTFDKWGNSTEATFAIPQSFAEFEAILRKAQKK